jgi:V8-like Glu-specific endopeptidase
MNHRTKLRAGARRDRRAALVDRVLAVASVLAVAACSAATDDATLYESMGDGPEVTSSEAEPIISGSSSSNKKVVQVLRDKPEGNPGLCTGTLLRSNIVLTADHCVGNQDGGQWLRHRIRTRDGTVVEVTDPSQLRTHPTADIAVLLLDDHVTINGRTDYTTGLHTKAVAGLEGKDVNCVGYGIRTCGSTDSGVQTQATLRVDAASSTSLRYLPNASGQILASSDSGGPCFLNGKVVGTTRTALSDCSLARQTPVTTYASWIEDAMEELLGG